MNILIVIIIFMITISFSLGNVNECYANCLKKNTRYCGKDQFLCDVVVGKCQESCNIEFVVYFMIISSNGINGDCYSDCVDDNREFCKTEWSKCVALMQKCRDNCDVQLEN
ncbi:hypothetical protein ACTFIY_009010 [Dictyostelium cf. discoideum]